LPEPISRTTSKEHFSELANVGTPTSRVPPCYSCPERSFGFWIDEILQNARQGNTVYLGRFFCKEHHDGTPQAMSYAIFPHYEVTETGGGKYRLMRLTRDQAIGRVKG
jgi:hypothetical protein